jgi:hypothetical protein
MGFKRQQRSNPDKSKPAIVKGLKKAGFIIIECGRPVDLLVTHPKWGPNRWRLLECKSHKDAKGNVKLRKDQQEQQEFCKTHGVPYVTDAFEALLALGEVIQL